LPDKKKEKKVQLLDRLPRPGRSGWVKIAVACCALVLLPFVYAYVAKNRARLLRVDQVALHYLAPRGYKLAYRNADCLRYLNQMQRADLAGAPDRVEAAFAQGAKVGCFARQPEAQDLATTSVEQVVTKTLVLSDAATLKHVLALRSHLVDSDDCAYYQQRSAEILQDPQKENAAKAKALQQLFDTARTFRCLK
jgi:hypothetical protein